MLKKSGVPARDAQLILGHSTVLITQEIYQHDDMDSRTEAMSRIEKIYMRVADGSRCRQILPSKADVVALVRQLSLAGETGLEPATLGFGGGQRDNLADRLTSVRAAVEARGRSWIVGTIAVNFAVNQASRMDQADGAAA